MNTQVTDNGLMLNKSTRYSFQKNFRKSLPKLFNNTVENQSDITPVQALTTSLASSLGAGSIVGVAVAISTGGPGTVFWMILAILLGSILKFAETLLTTKYRVKKRQGEKIGGPMYYIRAGMAEYYGGNWAWLGWFFAFFATLASFLIGNMIQSNMISESLFTSIKLSPEITGAVFTFFTALIILGGIQSIGKMASTLLPLIIVIYVACSAWIIFNNLALFPNTIWVMGTTIFSAKAVGGGLLGNVIRIGLLRGMLANEVGFGTSSISYAPTNHNNPVLLGLFAGIGSLIITVLMCLSTAFVIMLSGLIKLDAATGFMTIENNLSGAALTTMAFNLNLPGFGGTLVSISLILFGVTTMVSWYYYGSKCLEYMAGSKSLDFYKWIWITLCFLGTLYHFKTIWDLSNLILAFMVIPNLIALIALSPVILRITKSYLAKEPDFVQKISS